MTEAEWTSATTTDPMLNFLFGGTHERKRRLFACACCRRHWDWVEGTEAATAVEVAEAHADGHATDKKLEAARNAARQVAERFYAEFRQTQGVAPYIAHVQASACAAAAVRMSHTVNDHAGSAANFSAQTYAFQLTNTTFTGNDLWHAHADDEAAVNARLLREIVGNPFRPVAFNPIWRTSDVMLLAHGIYDEKAFDRMPILADALQDAGCTNDAILNHLRDPALVPWERPADAVGPAPVAHVRGCWALDLVLGKE